MAKYVSRKTGAVVDTDCRLLGDWVEVSELEKEVDETPQVQQEIEQKITPPNVNEEQPKQEPIATQATAKGANDAYDSITVPQIKQELDAFGIEYDKRANKQVLYDLMMQGK